MAKPRPRPGLSAIAPYVPGKAKLGDGPVHKLSSNESALGPSPRALEAYQSASAVVERYPDGDATALRAVIGEVHGLDPSALIIGAGSDDIIEMLIHGFCDDGDEVLQTRHGFSYYAVAARAGGATPVLVDEVALTADVDALIAAQTDRTRLLFLANPNNPTGTMLDREALLRLREGLREDIILVLDGAYAEYVSEGAYTDGRDLVDAAIASGADNVIMIRTFSKVYGLGGLRVGWGYGPAHIMDILGRIRSPFNVSGPALAAAAAAMADQSFVAENRAHNDRERARVHEALSGLGYVVTPGFGNFLLFTTQGDDAAQQAAARKILAHLETHRVLIRAAASSNLPGYLRVSIGLADDNDAFLDGMRALTF